MANRSDKFAQKPHLDRLGGALWLSGKKVEAAEIWLSRILGLSDGTFGYADKSGGMDDGLLLWYAAVSLKDSSLMGDALKFLRKKNRLSRAKYMPGPLADLVLQRRALDEILDGVYGTGNLVSLESDTGRTPLLFREITQILLCAATSARHIGNETECSDLMRRCARLRNPLIQIEWFLARGESEIH
jgi:hypothetical protein